MQRHCGAPQAGDSAASHKPAASGTAEKDEAVLVSERPSETYDAGVTVEVPHQPLLMDQSDVRYLYVPDSLIQSGTPAGQTVDFEWSDS